MLDFLFFFGIIEVKRGKGGIMERKIGAPCVLYERDCIGCLECETCDLDPNKVCDNCGKCIEMDDVASIKIDKIYTNPNEYKE
jgi:hypothetical protein